MRTGSTLSQYVLEPLRSVLTMSFVLSLLLMLSYGIFFIIEGALGAYPEFYSHPARWSNHANTLWISKELCNRKKPAILIAGSSTTRTAFDETIFFQAFDNQYYVENISNSTTDPAGIYHYLRYLEKNCAQALPDILIQGIEELELQDEYKYGAFHSHLTHFFADFALFNSEPLYQHVLETDELSRNAKIESLFPLYSRRSLLQGAIIGRTVWPLYKQNILGRDWLSRFHLRPYDWNYFRVVRQSDAIRRLKGLEKLKKAENFLFERYDYPNAQTKSLKLISDFCIKHGILHYAVVMPGVPEKFDDKYLSKELVDKMAMMISQSYQNQQSKLIWSWNLLQGADFFDSLHINQYGRGVLSRMMVKVIADEFIQAGYRLPYSRQENNLVSRLAPEINFNLDDRQSFLVAEDSLRKR